jgi:hypothetical protein
MANAAGVAEKAYNLAATGADIAAGINAVAGVASLATGGAVSAAALPMCLACPAAACSVRAKTGALASGSGAFSCG